MKKLLVAMVVLGLTVTVPTGGFCEEKEQPVEAERYDPGWGSGHGMGYGLGRGHMMDYDYGLRPDYSVPGPLKSLKPEEREKWEKIWAQYLMDTLEIRRQIAVKRIELDTLWAQPTIDRVKVEKLSSELSQLYAERGKACDNYVLRVREEFGRLGWACPIGRW